MPGAPAVTVVIPTRDRPAWLARAVALALRQRGIALRVVVVDDGSTDAAGVRAAVGTDPRVELWVRDGADPGVARARNFGLAQVDSPFVAFLDDDDIWHPDWLHTATAALERDGADLVFGPVALLDLDGDPCGWEPRADPAGVREGMARDNVVGVPSQVVVRTEALRAVGGWDERFTAMADWATWLRLRDAPCTAVDDVLVGYTVHPDAMHLRDADGMMEEFRRLQEVTGLQELDETRFLRWLAQETARFGDRGTAIRLYRELAAREHRPRDLAKAARLVVPFHPGLRRRFSPPERTPWWPAAVELSRLARGTSEPAHA